MKLYFAPGACSLAPRIVIGEAGLNAEFVRVDLATKKTEHGEDFLQINGKGYVPALRRDDGSVLTEVSAILQYLADQNPTAGLAPAAGSADRYRLQEWLGFISTELHKGLGTLYNPVMPKEAKALFKQGVEGRLQWLAAQLQDKEFVMGNQFTVADAYLFTVLNWAPWLQVDLAAWPAVHAYHARMAGRPQIVAALSAEGLLQ
jgi:glutathione S-transferase